VGRSFWGGMGRRIWGFLREVREKYDAEGLWKEKCPEGFKVFR
jgi:hypothetical protein